MTQATRQAPARTGRSMLRPTLGTALLALALAAGCEPTSETTPDMATNTPDMAAQTELKPKLVPVSAAGHDRFFGVAFDSQGRFYATGSVADGTDASADFKMVVARFGADGALDTTFGTGGYAIKNVAVGAGGELARGIVVQSSGKIVISGTVEHAGAADPRDRDVALVRFNSDGTVDSGFGTQGVSILDLSAGEVSGTSYIADTAWGLTVYPDNRLLVHAAQKRTGATDLDFAVVRLTADGARDMSFGTMGVAALDINNRSASPRTTTLLPDGSIVAAGYYPDGSVVKPVLFKLTSTGMLDRSFGTNGIFTQTVLMAVTEAYAADLQGTSFVTAGYGNNGAPESIDWVSLRVTAAGQLDQTYGTGGVVRLDLAGFNDNSRALAVLPDSRILLIGGGRTSMTNSDGMIAMLRPDGQKDTSFSQTGIMSFDFGASSDFFWGVAVSPDKSRAALVGTKAVVAGTDTGNDDGVVMVLPLGK
jgi:uncharacterized delta-60 repeat protein